MTLVSHGIDLVECARIEQLITKHNQRFFERVLTKTEHQRASRLAKPVPHIAGRFAAKEAILKVLGTGWRGGIAWTDIEITNDVHGAPRVSLSGECHRIARNLGIDEIVLSISHTESYAMASALGIAGKSTMPPCLGNTNDEPDANA